MPITDRVDPKLLNKISSLPQEEQAHILSLFDELEDAEQKEGAREHFMDFVHMSWPAFIGGRHHGIMAKAFERVASGELKRLIINMPPRHTKSEFASYLLPAWFLGRYPEKKIIQTAHTAELSVGFGRKVRNLVDSSDYKKIFPSIALRADSKAAGRWSTNKGGEYFAIGVGGAVTGNKRDLTGQILKSSLQRAGTDEWEVIEFPALMPSGDPLWPEFWPKPELEALREELPSPKWNAQYQQNPTSEEGALVKRDWWREWEKDRPPACEFIIQSWDTAFLKTQRADYSACTTWGVFYWPDDTGMEQPNIILLDAYKERLEFPELKKTAFEMWTDWQPDAFIVEAKAAGTPLIFELRAMGIPVSEYTPSRGNDKIARVNAVADLFASGMVWAPRIRFAEEVIEEFASFPAGEHDDLVDSSTQALLRFRQGGFLRLVTDEEDEPVYTRKAEYY